MIPPSPSDIIDDPREPPEPLAKDKFQIGQRVRMSEKAISQHLQGTTDRRTGVVVGFPKFGIGNVSHLVYVLRDGLRTKDSYHMDFWESVEEATQLLPLVNTVETATANDLPSPEPDPPRFDPRWLCYLCGDLALLDQGGRCRNCRPERSESFMEICTRAFTGAPYYR